MALKRAASVTDTLISACEAFDGLPPGVDSRYGLIRMAERAGRHFGLTHTDLRLLTLYVGFTRAVDWQIGGRPVYTRPVFRTASDLGISERQVNRSERRLEQLGLLYRDTRADGARGFVRGGHAEAGETIAYCIDLRPLAVAWPALCRSAEAVRRREEAIDAARAAISRRLRVIPALLADAMALDPRRALAEGLAALWEGLPRRTPRHRDLSRLVSAEKALEEMIATLRAFVAAGRDSGEKRRFSEKESDAAARDVGYHYNTTPDSESCKKMPAAHATDSNTHAPCGAEDAEKKACGAAAAWQAETRIGLISTRRPSGIRLNADFGDEAEADCGLDHLTTRQVVGAMPESWAVEVLATGPFNWRVFCYAAEARLHPLGVGNHAWTRLKRVIGRRAACIALMALEINRDHPVSPVRNVGGAVFSFADRAREGRLRLDAMLLGILARREAAGSPVFAGDQVLIAGKRR